MRKHYNSVVLILLLFFSFGKSFAQCGSLLAPSVTNVSKCQDSQNTTLTATAKGSGELQWFDGNNTATATKLGSPSASYTSTVTTDGNYKYYVAEYDNVNQCYGPVSMVSLTINPKPIKPIVTGTQSICDYAKIAPDFIVSNATSIIKWVNTNTGVSLGTGISYKPNIPILGTETVSFGVIQEENGCISDTERTMLKIIKRPVAPIATSDYPLCSNNKSMPLFAQTSSTSNFLKWYLTKSAIGTSNFISGDSLDPNPYLVMPNAGNHQTKTTFYVTQSTTTAICESAEKTICVMINVKPDQPTINKPYILACANNKIEPLEISPVTAGMSYQWYNGETGVPITTEGTISGTSKEFFVPNQTVANSIMSYYVKQTNKVTNCKSDSTVVTYHIGKEINQKPVLLTNAIPMVYEPGIHKTFEVFAQGDSLIWSLNDSVVSGGSKYDYYPKSIGIDTFHVSQALLFSDPNVKNSLTCPGPSLTFTQKVQLEPYTNSNFTYLTQVKVFPNPTIHNITISLGEFESETTIVLFDILGIVLQTKKIKNEFVDLDLSGYAAGIYSVSVSNKKGYWLGTVVKE